MNRPKLVHVITTWDRCIFGTNRVMRDIQLSKEIAEAESVNANQRMIETCWSQG